ncbi:hypothetical protein [Clostridium sp. FP1]|uniref:hypothetical protein n=1 Tax=Clostridium sp. FP1 TaxID=2724076 RepID=UPI0013E92ED4|nr:hypothetical protein [Clostridium sp. FP1]MBZ9633085.1 hypothetical protein [Clostridium sp. FP1]
MYTQENGTIFKDTVYENSIVKECIGNATQYSIAQADTQIKYQWQKFNLDTGVYENDTTNTTEILGKVPVDGQVSIKLSPVAETPIQPTNKEVNDNILVLMSAIGSLYEDIVKKGTV